MYTKLIEIINGISCFQLVIFTFFLIHKGRKNKSNLILASFFSAQFIVIFHFLLRDFIPFGSELHLKTAFIYYPFEYLWGPLIYFYVKSQLNQNFQFKKTDLLHLLPFITIAGIILVFYYFQDVETKQAIISGKNIYNLFSYLNIPYFILLFSYNFIALLLIRKEQNKQNDYFSFNVNQTLNWLKIVMYGYVFACILTAITNAIIHFVDIPQQVILILLFVPYLILFNVLFYIAITHPQVITMHLNQPKSINPNLNEKNILEYAQRIEQFVTDEKPYLNHNLTLKDLADGAGIDQRIISQVINGYWNQNFFTFINSYRVKEAQTLLHNFDQQKSTMLGISLDAGFNSKTAFYDAFKKHTGMTPTQFRRTEKS